MINSTNTRINHAGSHADLPPTHEHDREAPLFTHTAHNWARLDRWHECSLCGARDYWPAGASPCPRVPRTEKSEPVTLSDALATLRADLEQFEAWWKAKALGGLRPTLAEWAAEFWEWRRIGQASY